MLPGDLVTHLDEGPDQRGRGVVLRDLVALDDLPRPVRAGVHRVALVHHPGGAVVERPVDDVAVAGDPADVGGAPVHRVGLHVEDVMVCRRDADQVAGGRVRDPLRLARRAARIEEVQQVLRVHRLARARTRVVVDVGDQLVPPVVAAPLHRHFGVGAAKHDTRPDRRAGLHRLVRGLLQRHLRAASPALVLRDQHLAFHVLDPTGERLGRETPEHDRVRRAESCAREHRRR